MSAKDRFHQAVKVALIKDRWTITHDPLSLDFDNARIQIDLGGEQLIAADQGLDKIAVEVKSFLGASVLRASVVLLSTSFTWQLGNVSAIELHCVTNSQNVNFI